MTDGNGGSGEEARRRREKALKALAEGSATAASSERASEKRQPALASALSAPRRMPRWLIPVISGVVLLAVAAVAVGHFLLLPAASTHRAPTYLSLDPEAIGIACLTGAAWSPDGSKLAILGVKQSCNASGGDSGTVFPNVVAMVDPASGKSVSQILPDTSVQKALKLAGRSASEPIFYTGVIWSPDGKRLALPFTIYFPSAQSGTGGIDIQLGLCVITLDDAKADVYLVPAADADKFTGEWDLKTGKPMMRASIPSNQVMVVGQLTLEPAALRYTWQPDGSLAPTGLLNATSAPAAAALSPVGNPDGDASFTAWQPMQILQNTGDPAHPVSPAPFVAYGTFLAWSPNGTYLLNAILGPWRILPSKQPIPGSSQLKATFTDKLPLLPIRDAALDAALNGLAGKQSITSNDPFAWSPNGRTFSAIKQVSGDKTLLTVLDCATAKTLSSVTLHGSSSGSSNIGNGDILWSPDGKRLLVLSGAEMFILGQGALP